MTEVVEHPLAVLAGCKTVASARSALAAGRCEVSGLGGSARLLLPLLLTELPLLLVVSREKDVEAAAEDLRTLAAELGRPGEVLALPSPGLPFRGLNRHPEASLRRASVLRAAAQGRLGALVASPAGLLRPVLTRPLFETRALTLRRGDEMIPELLLEALDEAGYRREDPVTAPGQMARRGGILDLYPPECEQPIRVELLGDTIESLRAFDPESQRTRTEVGSVELMPLADLFLTRSLSARLVERLPERFPGARGLETLLERLRHGVPPEDVVELLPLLLDVTLPAWGHLPRACVVAIEPEAIRDEAEAFLLRAREERERRRDPLALTVEEALLPLGALVERLEAAPCCHLREVDPEQRGIAAAARPAPRYGGDLPRLARDLEARSGTALVLLGSSGRAERLAEVLREARLAVGAGSGLELRVGTLSAGCEWPEASLTLLADGDVFPEEVHLHGRRRFSASARSFLSDFRDLKVGDLVVHEEHGIGRFAGLETIQVANARRDFMVLHYQGGDKLKVPIEAFDCLQKYSSVEGSRPALDRLGSGSWERTKTRVKRAMRDMAAELLRLYAERKAREGHAFTAASPWLAEFEQSFEYEETPDQRAAIADVAADMASPAPMDRLVCGDVGYGKTEVAMRAAMRAVLDGKQVAVLAPTTVLAFQHWKTFRKRFAPFPVRVEMVSRFRTPKQTRVVLAALAQGAVDVLIGTHRLLSRDVVFQDLGLLVIDEEQRFGVAAKERLKQLRTGVDCLTLSATPIPRTLQMGLAGIRDMSVIETPPKDRLAILTSIVGFSKEVVASAIRQELQRGGQTYLVHNRVESIYALANLVTRLVPEATVAVAHGQMPETQLENTMLTFVEGRADVLVSTTIVENGLDIPRVNTILVNRADRYGLAQLYQLRGRVGRSDRRAYAYLLVPPGDSLSELARKRLRAIREFSELGAGFRIAALDLELRGAGNLLGGEQSGHLEAVGLDLYVKLLEQTVLELKGEAPTPTRHAALNLQVDLRLPDAYVPETHQRLSLYKRVSQARDETEVVALRLELLDRYGPLPAEADGLLAYAALRLRADRLGLQQVDRVGPALAVRFSPEAAPSAEGIMALLEALPGASLSPQGFLRCPLLERQAPLPALEAVLGAIEAALPPRA